MLLRNRLITLLSPPSLPLPFNKSLSFTIAFHFSAQSSPHPKFSASKTAKPSTADSARFARTVLFVPPGVDPDEVTENMVLPGSNIVVGPYAGHSQIKEVEFVKSSSRARDCPREDRPEFAILGRSNVGKSSLINALVRKKEVALTSKKPGKTQLINHFLVNKSWYIVDLPGYGFAKAPASAQTDWSSFTKGYFLNRETLVAVLLLIDASVPPQKIDLDCADWLGRNNIPLTFVFTKCDKMKGGKSTRPDENIRNFQELIRQNYQEHPPWIMTSSVTGLGRDELLLHMSQLRNYWDQ
ncbi:GTP-binding protein At2g22870 [Ricinus communis]|uniref:GTP-binding protein engB, putative n=1 Tax=Ricinus communis TaxID=3988 RepID=B9SH28_RICCO|nr:GTP-binding protein At2g22870 [Ricinus communis]EEF37125.1 GTP-binding protein engB, putative [Ricinus communis]|eukprot:XP_002525297.1 GTP-binding protein At2g22870 [Ricinus communis]